MAFSRDDLLCDRDLEQCAESLGLGACDGAAKAGTSVVAAGWATTRIIAFPLLDQPFIDHPRERRVECAR